MNPSQPPDTTPNDLLQQARALIISAQNPSVGLLQRYFKIGYNRALSLMTPLEGDIVTVPDENGWRQMLGSGKRSPDDPRYDSALDENATRLPSMETSMGLHSLSPDERAQRLRSS